MASTLKCMARKQELIKEANLELKRAIESMEYVKKLDLVSVQKFGENLLDGSRQNLKSIFLALNGLMKNSQMFLKSEIDKWLNGFTSCKTEEDIAYIENILNGLSIEFCEVTRQALEDAIKDYYNELHSRLDKLKALIEADDRGTRNFNDLSANSEDDTNGTTVQTCRLKTKVFSVLPKAKMPSHLNQSTSGYIKRTNRFPAPKMITKTQPAAPRMTFQNRLKTAAFQNQPTGGARIFNRSMRDVLSNLKENRAVSTVKNTDDIVSPSETSVSHGENEMSKLPADYNTSRSVASAAERFSFNTDVPTAEILIDFSDNCNNNKLPKHGNELTTDHDISPSEILIYFSDSYNETAEFDNIVSGNEHIDHSMIPINPRKTDYDISPSIASAESFTVASKVELQRDRFSSSSSPLSSSSSSSSTAYNWSAVDCLVQTSDESTEYGTLNSGVTEFVKTAQHEAEVRASGLSFGKPKKSSLADLF